MLPSQVRQKKSASEKHVGQNNMGRERSNAIGKRCNFIPHAESVFLNATEIKSISGPALVEAVAPQSVCFQEGCYTRECLSVCRACVIDRRGRPTHIIHQTGYHLSQLVLWHSHVTCTFYFNPLQQQSQYKKNKQKKTYLYPVSVFFLHLVLFFF